MLRSLAPVRWCCSPVTGALLDLKAVPVRWREEITFSWSGLLALLLSLVTVSAVRVCVSKAGVYSEVLRVVLLVVVSLVVANYFNLRQFASGGGGSCGLLVGLLGLL